MIEETEAEQLGRLEARIAELEQRQQLLQRTDPAIALGTALHDLGETPAASAFRSTTQTISTGGAGAAVAMDSELFDTDGMHDTATNTSRVTFNTAGIYFCEGLSGWSADPVTGAAIIHKNGTAALSRSQLTADYRVMGVTCIRSFEIGDYIELVVYQASGGDLTTLTSAGNHSRLTAVKLLTAPP